MNIYKKNYSFSRVVFLFFYLTKTANSFYSKINDRGRRRTTRFSIIRFGVRVTALPNFFTIYLQHFSTPEIDEILKWFPYENFRHCETKNFRRKILILPPPLLSINFLATGNVLKHSTEGFPYEIFRHCETKNFRRKFLVLPPTLSSKLCRYPKLMRD